MNKKVDKYLNELEKWKVELTQLRKVVLACGLNEDYKWRHPSYSDNGKNIVLIHEFKEYCAILFQKGVLLEDAKGILVQPTENTRAARQIRFTDLEQIDQLEGVIQEYIKEAIEIERSGKKVAPSKVEEFGIPDELELKFSENPGFEKAFRKLTEGRQKGYLLYFSQPKQVDTRTSRIQRKLPRILAGFGLKDCICGLSKRKPNCDGSHKHLEKSK